MAIDAEHERCGPAAVLQQGTDDCLVSKEARDPRSGLASHEPEQVHRAVKACRSCQYIKNQAAKGTVEARQRDELARQEVHGDVRPGTEVEHRRISQGCLHNKQIILLPG